MFFIFSLIIIVVAFFVWQAARKKVSYNAMYQRTANAALAVVGGGISGAAPLFLPALINELNSAYTSPTGEEFRRLTAVAFNLEDPAQLATFLKGETRTITVPGSQTKVQYDPLQRIGVGMSRLGTSEATAIGAYVFALRKLDGR